MKQSKSITKEPITEKQNLKNNQAQNPSSPKKDDKQSWAVYYLFGSFIVGAILLILKVIGIL